MPVGSIAGKEMTPVPVEEPGMVLVVDDDAAMREAIENLLLSVDLPVRTFGSPAEFARFERPDLPACLVLDIRMPGRSGLEFQQDLRAARLDLPIIFVTGHGDVPMSVRAMKAGAVDFFTKPFRDQDLLDAIQAGLERDRARRRRASAVSELKERYEALTARERQVMAHVIRGLRNGQIADTLGVSEITVKAHRGSVMRKMLASDLPDLVRMGDLLARPETLTDTKV